MPSMTLDQALATIPKDQQLYYKIIADAAKKNLLKFKRTINHVISYLQYRQTYVLGRYNTIDTYLTVPINLSQQFSFFNAYSKSNFNKSQDLDNITALFYKIVGKELDLIKIYKRENIEVNKNLSSMATSLSQLISLKTQIDVLIAKLPA